MIVRDGRRVSHDLGPRRTFAISEMKMIHAESTGSGRWQTMPFETSRKMRPAKLSRPERERAWRLANLEVQREKERLRQQRHRDRKRAAIAASAFA